MSKGINMTWLDNLKVGDEVFYKTRMTESVIKVTNITKTQIHCGSSKFRKDSGRLMTQDKWASASIVELNDEIKNRLKIKHMRFLIDRNLEDIDDESIIRMWRAWKNEK